MGIGNYIDSLPELYKRVTGLELKATERGLEESLKDWKPRFTIADRDVKIKVLEAQLEAQRAHYQGELDKARKAVDAISTEYARENKRRIEVEDLIAGLKEEIARDAAALKTFGIQKNEIGYWQSKDQV